MVGIRTDECFSHYLAKDEYFENGKWEILDRKNLMSMTLSTLSGKKFTIGQD